MNMPLILLSSAMLLTAGSAAAPPFEPPLDVEVVNDSSAPVPVTITDETAETTVERRYIGLTEFADDGSFQFEGLIGIAALHAACEAEFGAGARAATIAEAVFRRNVGGRVGWLAPGGPVIVGAFTASSGAVLHRAFDAATGANAGASADSSAAAITGAYCRRYFDNSGAAPTIAAGGQILPRTCASSLPVACSAPVAVPVR